ncbi:MAG TPA: hypothetical protein VFI43_04305 [Nitrosospira sp.]|nr:hypothetical protein [Nitrosospira sp.]
MSAHRLLLLLRAFSALLLFALVLVPIFQSAHMLTHIRTPDSLHDAVLVAQTGGVGAGEDGEDADSGLDKICLDCLALAAFSVALLTLAVLFFGAIRRLHLWHLNSRGHFLDFYTPYLSRAPPQA